MKFKNLTNYVNITLTYISLQGLWQYRRVTGRQDHLLLELRDFKVRPASPFHFILGKTKAKGSYVTLLKSDSFLETKAQVWFSVVPFPHSFSEQANLRKNQC